MSRTIDGSSIPETLYVTVKRTDHQKLVRDLAEARRLLCECRHRIVNKNTTTEDYKRLDAPVVTQVDEFLDHTALPVAVVERTDPNRDPGCPTWLDGIHPEFVREMRSHQPTGPQLQNFELAFLWKEIAACRLISAIKYHREHTLREDLRESKMIVDKVYADFFGNVNSVRADETMHLAEWGIPVNFAGAIRNLGITKSLSIQTIVSMWNSIRCGRAVEAIRNYREITGASLKEGADLVRTVKDQFFGGQHAN